MGTVILFVMVWYGSTFTMYTYEMASHNKCEELGKKLVEDFGSKTWNDSLPKIRTACY